MSDTAPNAGQNVALVELVNRVVDRGVVLHGDITISVADVDLLYLGLQLVLRSAILDEERSEVRITAPHPSEGEST